MSENYRVGLDVTDFSDNGRRQPVSRVTLLVDDASVVTSGDDTGLEITADCPYATQEMADAILEQVKGYAYQAFAAGAANLDPAAELGDSITVSGVYSVISSLTDRGDGYRMCPRRARRSSRTVPVRGAHDAGAQPEARRDALGHHKDR